MPRNISFALTTEQFIAREKDVTRRMGWQFLQPGTLLNGCRQCQGLKRGEKIQRLGLIKVLSVRFEPLSRMLTDEYYGRVEVVREGFPRMTPSDFVKMLCDSHRGCEPSTIVTRIEFEYLGEFQQVHKGAR